MFGTTPPLCRPIRLFVLAILLVWATVAMPAASAQTGATVVAPGEVTGREHLPITVAGTGDAVTVTLTDAAAGAAGWSFAEDQAADRALVLDLAAPHSGAEPVNGVATLVVAAKGVTLHEAQVLLDRDPAAPALQVAAKGRRVDATWAAVSGPGTVTYRLERASDGGTWSTLLEAPGALSYVDRALQPGSYRYRLTASVPGAGHASNSAAPSVATVALADLPAPDDEKPATDTPPAPEDTPERSGGASRGKQDRRDAEAPTRTRRVAAAGAVTRGVQEQRRRPALVHGYSRGPALAGLQTRSVAPRRAARPRVAPAVRASAPPPSGIPWRTVEPAALLPVAGGGVLSVSTAAATDRTSAAVPLAVTLLVLLLCCHAAVWQRATIPAVADPR